jgi:gluconokinase
MERAKSVREYPIYSPNPDYREQDPKEILEAVIETLRESIIIAGISSEEISFVSFSSMMHSIIAVDENCEPLTQSILWNDNRSIAYVKEYKESGKGRELYLRTGTPTHPMSPLYKLMWLKHKQPEVYKSAHKFISIKEYVLYHFFNEYVVDYSVASATGIFNIFELKWDEEALDILEIDESKLSIAVPTTYIVKNLREEICARTGLTTQTSFVIGANDGCLANLGSNAIEEGIAAATIGTSGAVRIVSERPITDKKERTFCYYLAENKYVIGGAINNGGIVYKWFRTEFGEINKEDNEKINKIKPGSNGLLFLPFLAGERSPYYNPNLRGAYIGISDYHKKGHFAKALMEGICYDMKELLEAVSDLTGQVKVVYANGGFTRTPEWVQLLCDIFDVKINLSSNYESSSLGAVMLGMLAVGEVNNLEQCSFMINQSLTLTPNEETRELYNNLYRLYKKSIEKLTGILEELAEYQNMM